MHLAINSILQVLASFTGMASIVKRSSRSESATRFAENDSLQSIWKNEMKQFKSSKMKNEILNFIFKKFKKFDLIWIFRFEKII